MTKPVNKILNLLAVCEAHIVVRTCHFRLLILLGALVIISPLPRLHALNTQAAGSESTLRTEADILSVAVRVIDRNDNEVHGLTANQFSLYEDGIAQKISFFDAENGPVSLGILLDVSGSMGATGKLDQAKAALSQFIGAMRPADEVFYLRFHLQAEKVADFTSDPQRILSAISQTTATENGPSLYDATARGLCYMRNAHHHRQALLVVTDGADQSSHRSLEDLIQIVQASQAQVFIIGYLDKEEYDMYRKSRRQKVTLVTRQETDNPLTAFNRLAKESGAESFFTESPDKFAEAVETVAQQIRTQYTLAYCPNSKVGGFHRLEVRVAHSGVQVRARPGFAGVSEPSAGCENEKLKPYQYESKVTAKNGCKVYHEDFQDRDSGWPNQQGYHYKSGTYQMAIAQKRSESEYEVYTRQVGGYEGANVMDVKPAPHVAEIASVAGDVDPYKGVLVANGPSFADLDASVGVDWKSSGGGEDLAATPGLVFHLNNLGYYAVVVSKDAPGTHGIAFKLIKRYHSEPIGRALCTWKELPLSKRTHEENISVQCRGPVITIIFRGAPVSKFEDADFKEGQVGLIFFGIGHAIFRDLLAEEVHDTALDLPLSHEARPR